MVAKESERLERLKNWVLGTEGKMSDGRKIGADERTDCDREMTDEKEKLGDGKRRKVSDGRKKGPTRGQIVREREREREREKEMTDENEKLGNGNPRSSSDVRKKKG